MTRSIGLKAAGLALLLGCAMPAHAAQNLACATDLIDEPLSKATFEAYRADKNLGEVIVERVGKQLAVCKLSNQWSGEAMQSVIRIMLGQMLMRGVIPDIAAAGVSPEMLEKSTDLFLATLPSATLRKFVDGDVPDEVSEGLVRHLIVNQVVPEAKLDQKLGGLIGEFAAVRGNMTFFTEQFAAQ